MAVLLATTRLDVNKVMRKRMGVPRASFAPPEQTRELTGMEIGGVTPFALPQELVVYVDRAVMAPDWVIVGGGSRDRKLKIAPSALLVVPRAEVVDGLANPAIGSSA
jgi:prolyl-tRNA editing enzyme YbaK/EbsC (Cys-tRNA(Pro) deacylase)